MAEYEVRNYSNLAIQCGCGCAHPLMAVLAYREDGVGRRMGFWRSYAMKVSAEMGNKSFREHEVAGYFYDCPDFRPTATLRFGEREWEVASPHPALVQTA